MARAIRWAAVCAFLAAAVALVVGRPRWKGCTAPVVGPCDRYLVREGWMMPAILGFLLAGIACLVLAGLITSHRDAN